MPKMYEYLKVATFFIVLAFVLGMCIYWCGCESQIEKHVKLHHGKDCTTTVLNETRFNVEVEIRCPGDPVKVQTFRKKDD